MQNIKPFGLTKMKIPETYEEFLKLTDLELSAISKSDMTLTEAQRMMMFFDKFDEVYQKRPITESSNKNKGKTFGDYLK